MLLQHDYSFILKATTPYGFGEYNFSRTWKSKSIINTHSHPSHVYIKKNVKRMGERYQQPPVVSEVLGLQHHFQPRQQR